jgi:hypothetical protein
MFARAGGKESSAVEIAMRFFNLTTPHAIASTFSTAPRTGPQELSPKQVSYS